MTVTNDLSTFNLAELKQATKLLTDYCADPGSKPDEGVHVCKSDGNVFLLIGTPFYDSAIMPTLLKGLKWFRPS